MKRLVACAFMVVVVGCGDDDGGSDAAMDAARDSTTDASDASTDVASDTTSDGEAADAFDAGPPDCPVYQARCEGVCIPVSVDPDNCGGCDVVCGVDEACSAGSCESSCLPGLTICDRSCVDVMTDNDHCGDCGTVCGGGEGCIEGSCEAGAIGTDMHAECVDGGPPIVIEFPGEEVECGDSIATTTFRWALCSCMDASLSGPLLTDAYDSTEGAYMPGGRGGAVGLNGEYASSSTADVGGAFWASSPDGTNPSNDLTVRQELHVGGPFDPKMTLIESDAYVDGDVSTTSTITIDGTLHQTPGFEVTGDVTFATRVEEDVMVPPPCDCVDDLLLPVTEIVAARASDNDNDRIGLDPTELDGPDGPRRVDLPCGHYYLDAITGARPITIVAHGHVALYVGGDVQVSNALRIAVEPTGTLDVFIAGEFGSSSSMSIGSPNYPALSRFYIGSVDGWGVSSDSLFGAFFYAPFGLVRSSAPLEVFGGIFAGDFQSSSDVTIHYDQAVLRSSEDCDDPGDGCESCRDCDNQACIDGECTACTDSSQCCAPLICVDGVCVAELI